MRFPHFAVLACLEEFGSASQREISERLRLDASDRRRYESDLTSAGRHALRVRARSVDRMNDELFRGLEPEEREQLHALVLRAVRARATNALRQRPKAQR